MRLLKILLALIILALIGLVGYSFFGDMDRPQEEIRVPVDGAAEQASG